MILKRVNNLLPFSAIYWQSLKCLSTTSPNLAAKHQYAADMGASEANEEEEKDNKGTTTTVKNKLTKFIANIGFRPWHSTGGKEPTSMAFIDKGSGPVQRDVDIPLDKLFENAPKVVKRETKKMIKDLEQEFGIVHFLNPEYHTDQHGPEHDETLIEYTFKGEKDMDNWQTGCDSDWNEGYSKCELYRSDRGTAVFEGVLDKRVIKDGRTHRAGWCTMMSVDTSAFGRKRRYSSWKPYNSLLIKCRGDGRSYKVIMRDPEYHDITWGNSFSCPLHTHGGPYWQYEKIPFSRFFRTVFGRIQDSQYPVFTPVVSSIGIVLMDRIDGPFRLEVGFIGVVHDAGHTEKFAYESYTTPLPNPLG